MKDKDIRILCTRPLDEALVNKASEHQIIIDSISFIKTQKIIDIDLSKEIKELASGSITAVFTSMNGAEAVIENLQER
jgi:uroporphyrinogen-III synthase